VEGTTLMMTACKWLHFVYAFSVEWYNCVQPNFE
jgi:hypothetical protein